MKKILFSILVSFVVFQNKFYALFEDRAVDDSQAMQGEGGNIVAKIFEFANIFAGIVLALSIVAMIAGSIHLKWRLEKGVQWHQDSRAKTIIMSSGIGIIIALSAFAIGRFFADFAI